MFQLFRRGVLTLLSCVLMANGLFAEELTHRSAFFQRLSGTPRGQHILRDAEHQQTQSARRMAAQEAFQRQQAVAEKDRVRREAFESQQRFSLRLAASRAIETALWASSGFQTPFTCDSELSCVPWPALAQAQARSTAVDLTLLSPVHSQVNSGVVLSTLSFNRKPR